jgi:hypothetical protein
MVKITNSIKHYLIVLLNVSELINIIMIPLVNFINKLNELGFKVQAKNLAIVVQNFYDINQLIIELTRKINDNKPQIPVINIEQSDLIQKLPDEETQQILRNIQKNADNQFN